MRMQSQNVPITQSGQVNTNARRNRASSMGPSNWLQAAPAETRNYIARNMRQIRGR